LFVWDTLWGLLEIGLDFGKCPFESVDFLLDELVTRHFVDPRKVWMSLEFSLLLVKSCKSKLDSEYIKLWYELRCVAGHCSVLHLSFLSLGFFTEVVGFLAPTETTYWIPISQTFAVGHAFTPHIYVKQKHAHFWIDLSL